MRQRGDTVLIDLLNKFRTANIDANNENLLMSKFVTKEDDNYPHQAIHIWAENALLNNVNNPLFCLSALDILPKMFTHQLLIKP